MQKLFVAGGRKPETSTRRKKKLKMGNSTSSVEPAPSTKTPKTGGTPSNKDPKGTVVPPSILNQAFIDGYFENAEWRSKPQPIAEVGTYEEFIRPLLNGRN